MADDYSEQRRLYIRNVEERAKLAKVARTLKQRLGLASYKAQNGAAHVKFEILEPQIERLAMQQQQSQHKRKASQAVSTEPPAKKQHVRQPSIGIASHLLHPSAPSANSTLVSDYPTGMSLYDAMMTPTLNSMYGGFSPRPTDQHAFGDFTNGSSSNTLMSSGLAPSANIMNHPSPPRLQKVIDTDHSASLYTNTPSSPVSSARDETLYARPDSQNGTSSIKRSVADQPTQKPISSKDPNFAKSATEYMQAANTLTSLTSGPAATSIPAGSARISPPPGIGHFDPSSQRGSAWTGTPSEQTAPFLARQISKSGDRETAAELMLYLAQSPSPDSKRDTPTMSGIDSGDDFGFGPPLKGRKLFADMGPEPISLTSVPSGQASENNQKVRLTGQDENRDRRPSAASSTDRPSSAINILQEQRLVPQAHPPASQPYPNYFSSPVTQNHQLSHSYPLTSAPNMTAYHSPLAYSMSAADMKMQNPPGAMYNQFPGADRNAPQHAAFDVNSFLMTASSGPPISFAQPSTVETANLSSLIHYR